MTAKKEKKFELLNDTDFLKVVKRQTKAATTEQRQNLYITAIDNRQALGIKTKTKIYYTFKKQAKLTNVFLSQNQKLWLRVFTDVDATSSQEAPQANENDYPVHLPPNLSERSQRLLHEHTLRADSFRENIFYLDRYTIRFSTDTKGDFYIVDADSVSENLKNKINRLLKGVA